MLLGIHDQDCVSLLEVRQKLRGFVRAGLAFQVKRERELNVGDRLLDGVHWSGPINLGFNYLKHDTPVVVSGLVVPTERERSKAWKVALCLNQFICTQFSRGRQTLFSKLKKGVLPTTVFPSLGAISGSSSGRGMAVEDEDESRDRTWIDLKFYSPPRMSRTSK